MSSYSSLSVLDPTRVSILVADDFAEWRVQVRYFLEARPDWHIIFETSDGLQAVEKATELRPDVVLLDIGMPSLNGIEAATKIQQASSGSRIVFLTQNADSEVVNAALATGAQGYVLKLNAATELIPAITAALRDGNQHDRSKRLSSPSGEQEHQGS
jgi:DNA-binding NarL/FixJ family response regulator